MHLNERIHTIYKYKRYLPVKHSTWKFNQYSKIDLNAVKTLTGNNNKNKAIIYVFPL